MQVGDILKMTVSNFFFNFLHCSVKPQEGSYGVFVKEGSARCHLPTLPKVRLSSFVSSSLLSLCYFKILLVIFFK